MAALFLQYLNPKVSLAARLCTAYRELGISEEQREKIEAMLGPLRVKDRTTYEHCIRVGLLARRIARFMGLDQKALLYAGLMHDVGKAQVPLETLTKTEGWTDADSKAIEPHVMDGYRMVRDVFDFSAEVILWHHKFQPNEYPQEIPENLHQYGNGTRTMIPFYGRILAIADSFDAFHRINNKFGADKKPLTGEEIKEKMLKFNPDQRVLLTNLFNADILTTKIYTPEPVLATV